MKEDDNKMGRVSYENGKNFEDKIQLWYRSKHYWAYKIPTQLSGTIFDIIVAKGGSCLFIECKHVNGDKLRYNCGLEKKTIELNHFVETTNNNVYIYIYSEKLNGIYWTTWKKAYTIFKQKGYLDIAKDCYKANM